MRLSAKSAAWPVLLLLTGCIHLHKTQVAQNQPLAPPIEEVPPPKPEPTTLPPPDVTIAAQPQPQITPPPEPVKKPTHHKKPPTTAQVASNGVPAGSIIGQLSAGDPPNLRQQTDASIQSTEKSLNGIGRKLNDQEQRTVLQIQEFLKQAKDALKTGDVDGAHALAEKAKVLLDELHP
jgi:outer membrane biosynthesis protein TonB